jgi:hypothetical protein
MISAAVRFPRRSPLSAALLALAVAVTACSSEAPDQGAPAAEEENKSAPQCPEVGATRCDGALVATCESRAGSRVWGAPRACAGVAVCRQGACVQPSARALTQAASIETYVATLAQGTAWPFAVDAVAVAARERAAILAGDGSDEVFFGAAWRALHAFPQGHQTLYSATAGGCSAKMAYQAHSRFGVCGRPSPKGVVVTAARGDNKLGLRAGDVVVRAGEDRGEAIATAAYARPTCGAVVPSEAGRRVAGAATFFGNVPSGTALTVEGADGSKRDVVVPAESDTHWTSCTDPFLRSAQVYAEASVRPDGVAVIRLPSFTPWDKAWPDVTKPGALEAYVADYQAELVKVFDTVKSAPAIVWDVRGNTGGISTVGMAIVGGFPSARGAGVSYCQSRVPGSSPPAFGGPVYAEYSVTPGGPFAYAGKVAVVADGLTYSAGDYFVLATQATSDVPVIGSATAGAFGGGQHAVAIAGPPALSGTYDEAACFSAVPGAPLEGSPRPPTVRVDYAPSDLASGRDTLLEVAVARVRL